MLKIIYNYILNKCQPYWYAIFNIESENSHWEIWNDDILKTMTIHYVPEDNFTVNDIKITVPYEQFEELVKLIKKIDKKNCE